MAALPLGCPECKEWVRERQGLATRNACTKALFILIFHALGSFIGSPNPVCPYMTKWLGRRGDLREGNPPQDKASKIIWLINFCYMLSEWRGSAGSAHRNEKLGQVAAYFVLTDCGKPGRQR